MATAAKPASAMKAMNRSAVVKRDQVSIWLFVTEVSIARFRRKDKGGKPNLGKNALNLTTKNSMKTCTKCGEMKSLSEFYVIKPSGNPHGSCKECFKKASKKSKEKMGPTHVKNLQLQWWYGIGIEEYEEMLTHQNGKCICGAETGRSDRKSLFVDHDHDTGLIRGLLCNKCNRAIGLVDDPASLRALADYIESANARSTKRYVSGRGSS
jgi:hypothetical protein